MTINLYTRGDDFVFLQTDRVGTSLVAKGNLNMRTACYNKSKRWQRSGKKGIKRNPERLQKTEEPNPMNA